MPNGDDHRGIPVWKLVKQITEERDRLRKTVVDLRARNESLEAEKRKLLETNHDLRMERGELQAQQEYAMLEDEIASGGSDVKSNQQED